MKTLREVVILSLLAIVILCVLNVAAAPSMSASQMQSNSSTYRINIQTVAGKPYEKVPYRWWTTVNFNITGTLTKDGKPVNGEGILYHGEVIKNVPNPTQWTVDITSDGYFTDTFKFSEAGRHDLIYTYFWGDGLADFCQSDVISIYAVQSV
jgi:hypothetical protein